jgi:hypothetical protein
LKQLLDDTTSTIVWQQHLNNDIQNLHDGQAGTVGERQCHTSRAAPLNDVSQLLP